MKYSNKYRKRLKRLLYLLGVIGGLYSPLLPAQNTLDLGASLSFNHSFLDLDLDPDSEYSLPLSFQGDDFAAYLQWAVSPRMYLKGRFNLYELNQTIAYSNLRNSISVGESWGLQFSCLYRKPFAKSRLIFSAGGGIHAAITELTQTTGYRGRIQSGDTLFFITYRTEQTAGLNLGLTGDVQLEFAFTNGMKLLLAGMLRVGLNPFAEIEIGLSDANAEQVLNQTSRGSYLGLQFGISYPISRIWEGKKELGAP